MIRILNEAPKARPKHALFCRVRNEMYFMPHFLPHYRALGIEHFYFVDDRSEDGTREYLLDQPDCTVIEMGYRLSEVVSEDTRGKDVVAREVPEQVIGPGWILSVDADEFLVLPEEYSTIGDLTSDLEARGEISCIAAMVDFYPQSFAHRFVDRDLDPFKAFPFFDTGPYFIWNPGETVPFLLFAGVRHRINEWMVERDRGKVWQVYRPTILQKVPLIKWGNGMVPTMSGHVPSAPPYTGTQVVLAHFKFYPDLDLKIAEGIESNFYQGHSYYYRLLRHYIPVFENRRLVCLVSRRYRDRSDLTRSHLLFANGRPF
ncbi:MAG: glycosyltransferase family 2 protein [Sphingomonadales bacterium]